MNIERKIQNVSNKTNRNFRAYNSKKKTEMLPKQNKKQ